MGRACNRRGRGRNSALGRPAGAWPEHRPCPRAQPSRGERPSGALHRRGLARCLLAILGLRRPRQLGGTGYAPLGAPNPWGNATIDWEVGYDSRPLDTERVALANLTRDWQEDQRAGRRSLTSWAAGSSATFPASSSPVERVRAGRARSGLPAEPRPPRVRPLSSPSRNRTTSTSTARSWRRAGTAGRRSSRCHGCDSREPTSGARLDPCTARRPSLDSRSTSCATLSLGSRSSSSGRAAAAGAVSRRCARRGSAATGSGLPGRYRARAQLGSRFSATSGTVRVRAAPSSRAARRLSITRRQRRIRLGGTSGRPVEARSRPRNPGDRCQCLWTLLWGLLALVAWTLAATRPGGWSRALRWRSACLRVLGVSLVRGRPPTRVEWLVTAGASLAVFVLPVDSYLEDREAAPVNRAVARVYMERNGLNDVEADCDRLEDNSDGSQSWICEMGFTADYDVCEASADGRTSNSPPTSTSA